MTCLLQLATLWRPLFKGYTQVHPPLFQFKNFRCSQKYIIIQSHILQLRALLKPVRAPSVYLKVSFQELVMPILDFVAMDSWMVCILLSCMPRHMGITGSDHSVHRKTAVMQERVFLYVCIVVSRRTFSLPPYTFLGQ